MMDIGMPGMNGIEATQMDGYSMHTMKIRERTENLHPAQQFLSRSPTLIFFFIALTVFAAEAMVMLLLHYLPLESSLGEAFTDATLLVALISPALFFLLFQPMVAHIRERQKCEEILHKNEEEQFKTMIHTSLDGFIIADVSGHFLEVNDAYCQMLGYSREELLDMDISGVEAAETPEEIARHIGRLLEIGCDRFETRHRRKDGRVILDIEVSANYTYAYGGRIYCFLRDITERKQAELLTREFSAHLQVVREEEKARLAREIHDGLGSTLAALKIEVCRLDRGLSDDQKTMPQFVCVKSMVGMLDNVVKASRRIISDLRPAALDDLGLLAAIKWQADEFHKHTDIECQVVFGCSEDYDCENKLGKTLSINLFRIFQEALTNVARHSGASRVEVEFCLGNDEVTLSISDNGCGLSEKHTIASTSYGIRGMRERVMLLGGEIGLDSPPSGGFCVTAKLPLPSGNKGKS